ncbi:MAG: hypothetical protein LC104_11140 [Bacteroidales bacterium]|nr:hypothetical protein [Bacteroidales bacterium]
MSVVAIPRRRFDWSAFSKAITTFATTHGLEEAFPVVDDGRVVSWQDHREELLEDRDDLVDVPNSPLERLQAGFDLFVQFTMPAGCGLMICADGNVIEVPDLDDDADGDDQPATLLTDEERRLVEKTVCDECHAYGLVVSLEGAKFVFQAVLFSDTDGNSEVEAVVEAGLVEVPMLRFIESFAKRVGNSYAVI